MKTLRVGSRAAAKKLNQCWSLNRIVCLSEWNRIEALLWNSGGDAVILLTFNFNLEGYCTSSWHRMVGEYIGNVWAPGITGDTRYASGPPRAGVIIASCRARKLPLTGAAKWRLYLGCEYGLSEHRKQNYSLWQRQKTQKGIVLWDATS
jgi:hypothetical protein